MEMNACLDFLPHQEKTTETTATTKVQGRT